MQRHHEDIILSAACEWDSKLSVFRRINVREEVCVLLAFDALCVTPLDWMPLGLLVPNNSFWVLLLTVTDNIPFSIMIIQSLH